MDRTKAVCPDCGGRMYFDFLGRMYHCWRCGEVHSPEDVIPWSDDPDERRRAFEDRSAEQ